VVGVYTASRENVDFPPGVVGSIAAQCNPGDALTGGGFETFPGVQVTRSRPQPGNSWLVTAVNNNAATTTVSVFAVCADLTP